MTALLEERKTEHLVLLVGGNPLPNAVAGKLLVEPGGTITLIHSAGPAGTADVAQRLREWLHPGNAAPSVGLKEVQESNPTSISRGVRECLETVKAQRVGLNYTGGTKAMSVHAYRTLEQWAKEKDIRPVFSYLDARTLEMVFDPVNASSGEQKVYVGRALELKLTDLLALHGWTLQHEPTRTALLPITACALAKACATDDGFRDWKRWIEDELHAKCRRSDRDGWKSKTQLQSVRLTLPESESLRKVAQLMRSELELPQEGDIGLSHPTFRNEPKDFCSWLHGKWLEHHVLDVLNGLATSLYLHERAQNIVPKEVEFDVDVVAIRGYQLFAFSCSTDTKKSLLKLKLFEAYVRARQLGGDEARVALVCCSDDPDGLEHEMRRDVDPEGRIRVFGRKHLANLTEHLREWIRTQSGADPEGKE
ncbi:hypothetical protein HRbin08_00904 [bacterium HR08]|nr:hypothetical protein HRbin08_00904 [bacterium HR08]